MTPEQIAEIHRLLTPDEFGKRPTLQQVGDLFGVSRERIRQLTGNHGYKKSVELLKSKRFYWQRRLYFLKDITKQELAELYGVSVENINHWVGSKLAYERRVGKRQCTKCGEWFKFPDCFYRQNKTSYTTYCKDCGDNRTHEWNEKNRERLNARVREYNKRPERKAYYREYAKKNRWRYAEKHRKYASQYYYAHKDKILKQAHDRYVELKNSLQRK